MRQVGTFEAKNRLSALIDLVQEGEEIEITRNGKPVARLVAAKGRNVEAARRAAEELLEMRNSIKPDPKGRSIRELIDEGRRY